MVLLLPSLPTTRGAFRFIRHLHVKRSFSSSHNSLSNGEDELKTLESVADDLRKQPPPARPIRGKKNDSPDRYGRYDGAHKVDLPISPFMDEAVIAAREKHRTPKPVQAKELTPFQTKLQHNVYAQTLATPIRTCGATQTRLPLFFLLGFQLRTHPETGAPWYLPEGLTDSHPNFNGPQGSPSNTQKLAADQGNKSLGGPPVGLEHTPSEAEKLPAYQPDARMVARYSVVRDSQVQVGKYKGWHRILPKRLLRKNTVKVRDIVWREDMETFILQLLRDRVVQRLKHLLYGGSGFLAKSDAGLDGLKEDMHVGCVLWLGPKSSVYQKETEVPFKTGLPPLPTSARIDDTLDLMTMDYFGAQVPIHNLVKLLGKRHLEQLRESGSFFDAEVVIIKYKLNTSPARRQLWRLQGYLTEHN